MESGINLDWVVWSNPVAIWWVFLVAVSAANIAVLLLLYFLHRKTSGHGGAQSVIEPLLLLCAAYVIGCAFRSVLPRADVQRICLFDTWLSTVAVGRSVATIAELCFAMQWAIVLRALGRLTGCETVTNISRIIVPLIALAECCSWSAVITTDYLGNVLENSLWTVTFALVVIALTRLVPRFRGGVQLVIAAAALGGVGYVIFMGTVDVPMYFVRWQADLANGKPSLGFLSGLHDVTTRWVVTHDIAQWREEIPWMSLYFSMAVWSSLALGSFGLVKASLPKFIVRQPLRKATRRALPVTIRT